MPQFETALYGAQIFWLLVSFGFLYLMMSQLICPMIEEVLQEREKKIQTALSEAEMLNQKATDFHQRQQTYLMTAEQEKIERIQKTYREIQKKAKTEENKNESALRQRIRRAEQKIEKASASLRQESDQLSDQLAEQLVASLTRTEEQNDPISIS